MNDGAKTDAEARVANAIGQQLEHFRNMSPRCRGVELPDGIILCPAPTQSLYFYLRTRAEGDEIMTQVFASDSPYDRQKAAIGSAFMSRTDYKSSLFINSINNLMNDWIEFIR